VTLAKHAGDYGELLAGDRELLESRLRAMGSLTSCMRAAVPRSSKISISVAQKYQ